MSSNASNTSSRSSPDPLSMSRDRHQPGLTPIKSPFEDLRKRRSILDDQQRALRESSPNLAVAAASRTPSPAKGLPHKPSPVIQRRTMTFLTTPTKPGSAQKGKAGARGKDQDLSPWRIKVTVQAEPDTNADGEQHTRNSSSRSSARRRQTAGQAENSFENTRTVTVPLRRGDDDSPVRRPRRQLTPAADSRAPGQEDTPKKRGRGRPRKTASIAEDPILAPATPRRASAENIRSTVDPSEEDLRPINDFGVDASSVSSASDNNMESRAPNYHVEESQSPESRRASFERSQRIAQRKGTPRKPPNFDESTLSPIPETSPIRSRAEQAGSTVANRSTAPLDNHAPRAEDDTVALNISAVESEGFSMVSLESLRSHRERAEQGSHGPTRRVPAMAAVATHIRPVSSSEQRSTVRQEHEMEDPACRTPLAHPTRSDLSPKASLPSAETPPKKLTPAARAGAALQRALTNDGQSSISAASGSRETSTGAAFATPKDRARFFQGFGDRSNRELRAGLAMGELLARTQSNYPADADSARSRPTASIDPARGTALPTPSGSTGIGQTLSSDDMMKRPSAAKADKSFGTIGYKTYDEMSWKPTTPISNSRADTSSYDAMSWKPTTPANAKETEGGQVGSHRSGSRRAEQPQRLVEDVGQRSSANREPILDAEEDIEMVDPTADIWQDEADRSLEESRVPARPDPKHSKKRTIELLLPENTPDWQDLIAPESQPPRPKLPRTWRRESGHHFLYSDEVESPAVQKIVPAVDKVAQLQSTPLNDLARYFQDSSPRRQGESGILRQKGVQSKAQYSSPLRLETSRTSDSREANQSTMTSKASPGNGSGVQNQQVATVIDNDEADVAYYSSDESENEYPEDVKGNESMREQEEDFANTDDQEADEYASDDIGKDDDLEEDEDDEADAAFHTSHPRAMRDTLDIFQSRPEVPTNKRLNLFDSSREDSSNHDETTNITLSRPPTTRLKQRPRSAPSHRVEKRSNKPASPKTSLTSFVPGVNLLTRLKTYLYPDPPPPPSRNWTHNHYLILNQYFKAAARTPISQILSKSREIPNNLQRFMKQMYTTNPYGDLAYTHEVSLADIFVAHQFTVEALERGVPLITDGRIHVEQWYVREYFDSKGNSIKVGALDGLHYPLRDENGRIKRVKEDWGDEDVVIRVCSLHAAKVIDEHRALKQRRLEELETQRQRSEAEAQAQDRASYDHDENEGEDGNSDYYEVEEYEERIPLNDAADEGEAEDGEEDGVSGSEDDLVQ